MPNIESPKPELPTDPLGLIDKSLLLTPRQVAARLKISMATLRAWTKAGRIKPTLNLPRTRRFLASDVEALLATPTKP